MHPRRLLITALLLTLAACTVPPATTPTPIPTPIPPPTLTLPPLPSPTHTPPHSHTPTLPHSPTPPPETNDTSSGTLPFEPPPRPFDYTVVNPEPPRRVPNATRAFWVTDETTGEQREITARLRVQTEHAALWVEEGVWHDVRVLEEAAIFFETRIYTATRAAFGPEWTPGVDNDPHIHILHATGLGEGVLGYTSSADEFPRALYPFSNEVEMITVNFDLVAVASPDYYGLLARQFQRIIQWFHDRNEERWVKEGLAELSVHVNGLDVNGLAPGEVKWTYLERPDTSLTAWQEKDAVAHRGAACLFVTYFHERFGDEGTRTLVAQPLNGAAGFDATLAELGTGLTFEDFFAEWLAANYLGHDLNQEHPAPAAIYENYPTTVEFSVQQFGADYILLRGEDDLRIRFTGAITTPLLDISPHSGRSFWWSNRADESLTTLTRAFDFSNVSDTEPITLTYWTWYDVEPGYDYATVEISTDGGAQWQVLPTPSGTGADPHGNNPSWGYTGQSGDPPGWIQETVDLSAHAGDEVLVRFAYLTDAAVTGTGFVLDDIAIPGIGYADDVEGGAGGWKPAGFLRSDNSVSQRYLALLILIGPGEGPETENENEVTVERLAVGEDGLAEWTVPLGSANWREAVLVLSGLAPLTTYPATCQLAIEK